MYLFFDTETSDLPRNFEAPETDTANWPHLIQIAWVTGETLDSISTPEVALIRPQGFRVAAGAYRCHGISTEFATQNGVALQPVLDSFFAAVHSASTIVAHNIEFDANIIGAECARIKVPNPIRQKQLRCTMQESVNYCRLPSKRRRYKWPTLTELHTILFNKDFDNAHDASNDCLACMRCFFRLKELKAI